MHRNILYISVTIYSYCEETTVLMGFPVPRCGLAHIPNILEANFNELKGTKAKDSESIAGEAVGKLWLICGKKRSF